MSGNLSDKFLIASCLSGDEEAFGKLYDKYVNEIYRFAVMRLKSKEEAEDIVSETFLKTWQYLSGAEKHIDNFRALLYRIARNLIIDLYRKSSSKNEMLTLEDGQLEVVPDREAHLLDKAIQKDDVERILSVMNQLPDEYAEHLQMRFVQDLSISEIAKITNKKSGTVRVAIHRAIKQVKEIFKQQKASE